jgi:hypothetical protein
VAFCTVGEGEKLKEYVPTGVVGFVLKYAFTMTAILVGLQGAPLVGGKAESNILNFVFEL